MAVEVGRDPLFLGPCRFHKNIGLFNAKRTVDDFENGNDDLIYIFRSF